MQNKELKRKALEKIKSMGNGNKGITLVALVVTIVILLILAGITIELTLGSDGIIQKTKFAKNQSCMQSDKEAIQIAYSTVYHLYDKVVTAQDLQEQLTYDGKDAECEIVENNKIKVKIVKCEHEFLVDPSTGDIENTTSDGKLVENKISIEVDPSSNETESYKQQVLITVKSSRETITDNSVKILWTTDDSDNEPVGLSNGTNLSVENKDEKTMNSETVYTVTTSGDYYLWIKASINGKSTSQKFGPYKLLAAPSAKDIIFTPSTVAPTTSLNVKIAPSANFPGYVLQYQVDSTVNSKNWKNYTSEVNITENTTIWARLYNAAEDKEVVSSFVVTNICLHTSGWKVQGDKHYCELCRYSEKHNYESIGNSEIYRCSTCGIRQDHTFGSMGICSVCLYQCKHDENHGSEYWENGVCRYCGAQCLHNVDSSLWSNGMCMKCGAMCDHMSDGASWMDGRCSRCGYECQHQYDSSTGRCSICNYECSHMWMDGRCNICGKECEHSYNISLWSNGVCMTCGMTCQHQYDSTTGTCSICGMTCMHTYDPTGRCPICGYTDPSYSGM